MPCDGSGIDLEIKLLRWTDKTCKSLTLGSRKKLYLIPRFKMFRSELVKVESCC